MILEELLKSLFTPIISLFIAWSIGYRLTMSYAMKQKKKEGVLSTVNEFQNIYSEWFSMAKKWAGKCPLKLASIVVTDSEDDE